MPYPILHKTEVCAGVEQVGGDRMFEGMEMLLAVRNAGALAECFISSSSLRRLMGVVLRERNSAGALLLRSFR